ncbi:uncharacterized protein LOC142551235 isoform X2 [Primulina tabacum]|uniref:uncharacterized protein LOC142551235 isoform X2 n=1 Tax=Primulina tabacum TaxID=48773 RepID=UPI003F5AACC3
MNAQHMNEDDASQNHFFKLTMRKQWKDVVSFYITNSWAQKAKLTKSEDTALHVVISNYHPGRSGLSANFVKKMLDSISKNEAFDVLSMQNDKGNTPLHLAARVGWVAICESIISQQPKLVTIRNAKGETPLFVAACHGKKEAFICLYEIYKATKKKDRELEELQAKKEKDRELEESQAKKEKDQESEESLCRRNNDGNTVLHTAIAGAYFGLAYQIISYFPKLVDFVNVDGESPIHVLAKNPSVFKSSSHIGLYDSIIYHCIFIDELKQQRYNPGAEQNVLSPISGVHYPENYQTCVDIFLFLWNPIYKSYKASLGRDNDNLEHGGSNDIERQRTTSNESQISIKSAEEKSKLQSYFPANYATAILLFKFAVKVILSVLGVGFWRIKKIQQKKLRYSHARQIMDIMIDSESRYKYDQYKYDSNGQKPAEKLEPHYSGRVRPPASPPPPDELGAPQSSIETSGRINSSKDIQINPEKERNQVKSVKNDIRGVGKSTETPLLVAAKMGIPEMVEKILTTCPVAIHDLDSNGKNVLLLAAENRQTTVFNLLLKMKPTEDMFHQVDNRGNSILHLAAMMGQSPPWRIPGAALQMQWEIKWYKYVKHSIPPHYLAHHNIDGDTPRQVFTEKHKDLVKEGNNWLIKTSESCSFVAALIATVAFATSATVPGGLNDKTGRPVLTDYRAFDIFSIFLAHSPLPIRDRPCFLSCNHQFTVSRTRLQGKPSRKALEWANFLVRFHSCHPGVFLRGPYFHSEGKAEGCCSSNICVCFCAGDALRIRSVTAVLRSSAGQLQKSAIAQLQGVLPVD